MVSPPNEFIPTYDLTGPMIELERYSDRFKPAAKTRPLLSQEILNKEFFPPALWEAYFNQKKKPATGTPLHGNSSLLHLTPFFRQANQRARGNEMQKLIGTDLKRATTRNKTAKRAVKPVGTTTP